MKHILLPFLLLISLESYCQFQKGDKYLGVTVNFSAQRMPRNYGYESSANSFFIGPSVGFFLNEKLAVGTQLGYSTGYAKDKNSDNYRSEHRAFSIASGLFARRYFNLSDKFLFSIGGGVNFSRGRSKTTVTDLLTHYTTEGKFKSYQLSASIRPSFIFFPSPNWGFEASIGSIDYALNRSLSIDQKSSSFNIDYGTISLGLAYYFRKAS